MSEEKVKMRKQLGLLEGVAIILGIIFGSGIFISPKEVIEKTGSVWGALSVWAACGVLATLGALSYAELGTTLAQSGGDYHYINEAYGPLPAFLYLWDANLVFVPSTNAIMSLTFANNILQPIFPVCSIDPLCRKLIAAVTLCFLTFINAYDVRFTTRIQNVFMFTKISALIIIIVGGIVWMAGGGTGHFEDGWAGTKSSVSDWSVAFYSGIFSYSGWSYLNFMTEELRDPFVNLPRAIYLSLPLVTGIYLLANVAYMAVLGPAGVQATEAIAVDFSAVALGWLSWAMPALVAVAVLGGLSVHIMTSSRMCFAGARNGHMPALLAHINVKCMSPLPSLVFLMLISLIMLIPDNLTSLITYCTWVESFFTTLSCSAVLWLRCKRPDLVRPIKVSLWVPIVFVATCAILLVVPIVSEPVAVVAGALMTLAGVPVYYLLVHSEPKAVRELSGGTGHFEDGWAGTKSSVSDWSVAFYSGIFSYSGWSYLNFMTEELRDPFVNLPRAIYLSLPLVTGIYLLANVAYMAVLGPAGVQATEAIAVVSLWVPIVFVATCAILLVVPIVSEPVAVVAGALMTLAGVPVYYLLVHSEPKAVRELSAKFTHICQKLFLSAVEEKDEGI